MHIDRNPEFAQHTVHTQNVVDVSVSEDDGDQFQLVVDETVPSLGPFMCVAEPWVDQNSFTVFLEQEGVFSERTDRERRENHVDLLATVFLVELVNATVALDHTVGTDVERMVFRIHFRAVYTIFGFHGAARGDSGSIAQLNGEIFVIRMNAWFHNA